MDEVADLTRLECHERLRACTVGRLAVATPAGPHIAAVPYLVTDDALVLRTTPYSIVGSHGRGSLVAFEVDDLDTGDDTGWSVVVRGRAEPVTDEVELRRLADADASSSRPGSRRLHLRVRLDGADVSGRIVGAVRPLRRVDTSAATA